MHSFILLFWMKCFKLELVDKIRPLWVGGPGLTGNASKEVRSLNDTPI